MVKERERPLLVFLSVLIGRTGTTLWLAGKDPFPHEAEAVSQHNESSRDLLVGTRRPTAQQMRLLVT